jgi:hypothetical protein
MQKQRTGYVPKHVRERSARRRAALRRQGCESYSAYLTSPHWRALKVQYRGSDRPQACICGETEGIHLHHLTYDRIGAERLTDLLPLCRLCHELIHVLERRGEIGLDMTGLEDENRARIGRAYLAALAVASAADVDAYHAERADGRERYSDEERIRRVIAAGRSRGVMYIPNHELRLVRHLLSGSPAERERGLRLLRKCERRVDSAPDNTKRLR